MFKKKKVNHTLKLSDCLIKDKPLFLLDKSESDELDFNHYVDVLKVAIEKSETPFVIGVTGAWGSGKTQLVNHFLKKKLLEEDEKEYGFVYFDAWKYQEDSFRRQFLRVAKKDLKVNVELDGLHEGREEVLQQRKFAFNWELGINISFLLIAYVAAKLCASIFGWSIGPTFFSTAILGTTALLVLKKMLFSMGEGVDPLKMNIIKVLEQKKIINPIFSVEQFEDIFDEIVKKGKDKFKSKKIIVVVDNIDRCDSESVVSLLSTLKTYLSVEGCIYIIPVDEVALIQHVNSGHKVAENNATHQRAKDYLRKLFNLNIYLNPILPDNMEAYINGLVKEIPFSLSEDEKNKVSLMVLTAFSHTPRKIKQFFNNLVSQYLLLKSRHNEGKIDIDPDKTISFMAKLLIVREEWPDFYQCILNDPDFFENAQFEAEGMNIDMRFSEDINKAYGLDKKLRRFMASTGYVNDTNVEQYTSLKRRHGGLANSKLIDSLITNNVDEINAILNSKNSDKQNLCSTIVTEINDRLTKRNYPACISACRTLSSIFGQFNDVQKQTLANLFARTMSIRECLEQIDSIPHEQTFELLSYVTSAQNSTRIKILDNLIIEGKNRGRMTLELLKDLYSKYHKILPTKSIKSIQEFVTQQFTDDEEKSVLDFILPFIKDEEELYKIFVDDSLIDRIQGELHSLSSPLAPKALKLSNFINAVSKFFDKHKIEQLVSTLMSSIRRDTSWTEDKVFLFNLLIPVIQQNRFPELKEQFSILLAEFIADVNMPIESKGLIPSVLNQLAEKNAAITQRMTESYVGYLSTEQEVENHIKPIIEGIIRHKVSFLASLEEEITKKIVLSGIYSQPQRLILWDLLSMLNGLKKNSNAKSHIRIAQTATDIDVYMELIERLISSRVGLNIKEFNEIVEAILSKMNTLITFQKLSIFNAFSTIFDLFTDIAKKKIYSELITIAEHEEEDHNVRRSALNLLGNKIFLEAMEKDKVNYINKVIEIMKKAPISEKENYIGYLINEPLVSKIKPFYKDLRNYINSFSEFNVVSEEGRFFLKYTNSFK